TPAQNRAPLSLPLKIQEWIMSSFRIARFLVVVMLAGTGLSACMSSAQSAGPAKQQPPTVNVAAAVERSLATSRTFTGRLAAPHRVETRPRVSGYTKAVAFED